MQQNHNVDVYNTINAHQKTVGRCLLNLFYIQIERNDVIHIRKHFQSFLKRKKRKLIYRTGMSVCFSIENWFSS